MKLKKIPFDKAEHRPCSMRPRTSEMGRSTVYVKCPFCGVETVAYNWSLAGGGKRCENKDCRVFLGWGEAVRDMVPAGEAKEKSRGADALASPSR